MPLPYLADDATVLRAAGVREFGGQAELDILADAVHLLDLDVAMPAQGFDDVEDQFLGRRGAGGQSHGLHAVRAMPDPARCRRRSGSSARPCSTPISRSRLEFELLRLPTTSSRSTTSHSSRTADWRCCVA